MIKLEDLSFSYSKRKSLFSNLNLELESGRIYGLLGRNGAGKSTLLKLCCGLLFPTDGTCSVMGHQSHLRRPAMLEEIFFLPEEFDLPRVSMDRYAAVYAKFYPNFSHEQLRDYMQQFEVATDQSFRRMSFGQKKKAYISFALACNCSLLIMDEPTNGLDIPSKAVFRSLIAKLSGNDSTIIISTHQVRDLDSLIDAVVVIEGSDILLNATTREITDRLNFCRIDNSVQPLYQEESIHGLWGVVPNTTMAESRLDMEMLFNATVSNPKAIRTIFETKTN